VVNYNFPLRPEMYRRRETEYALLKGMEVKLHPPKAELFQSLKKKILINRIAGG